MHYFFLFFILSGFCSLVYQVVWLRIAMADFGVTATMISIVLSVFMAGLSFGSWGGGMVADRCRFNGPGSQLRLYGVLECVIGLSGIVSAPLLGYGQILLAKSTGTEWGSGSYYLASGSIIFLVLFPFCVCMGATFPIVMAAVKRAYPEKSATSFSYLYLANLLGAVLGCTGTAFVLIELIGFRGTMLVAAGFNMSIAAAAFVMSTWIRDQEDSAGKRLCMEGRTAGVSRTNWRLFVVLVVTGFVSMALEVVWARQFTVYLGPVVYTFAAILSLFLLANYSGSSLYRKKCGHPLLQHGELFLALLAGAAGFTALLTLVTADPRFPLTGILGGIVRVAIGVVPFGMTIGFMTPWVVDAISNGAANKAGKAYSLNAVGCILGPLVAGFVLLPTVGERWSVLLLAALLVLIIPLLLNGDVRDRIPSLAAVRFFRWSIVVVTVTASLLVLFTRGYESFYPESRVLRDHTATVVAEGTGWERGLYVNGRGMTVLSPITKMMAHLPLAMHETPPTKGLILCFGMGTSFRSMLSWGIHTTAVELVPSIPKMFGYFHQDAESLLADPHARIIVDDARRYLGRTSERYDVIVVDPPPPFEAAASSLLYSREFYREIIRTLAPGGVFHQWSPIDEPYELAVITKTLLAEFPHVRAFRSVMGWGVHFIASIQPLPERGPAELDAQLSSRSAADLVEWGPFSDSFEQLATVLSGELEVAELVRAAPEARAIEDDRPVNEYYLLRKLFR